MKTGFLLHEKIVWHGKISSDLSASFYPSFYKDILKREKLFLENFSVLFEEANAENLKSKFIPIYEAEIMSRENFTLARDTIVASIIQRVTENPSKYKLLSIQRNDGSVLGATLFSNSGNKLRMAFKAYKRDVEISTLKHKASLDYWGEKLIKEYGLKLGLSIFSYGRDTHPYIGRNRVGLALYKLKVGTRPRVPESNNSEKLVKTRSIDEAFLFSQAVPIVFFNNPDQADFFQNCFLYYPKGTLHESFVNEFKIVSEWAGLVFESLEY